MNNERKSGGNNHGGSRPVNDGYQPTRTERGYQPAYTPSSPGAGHQLTGTGTPQPPTTGSGVKPAPAKND